MKIGEIKLTKHAITRAKQRFGWSKRELMKVAPRAWCNGDLYYGEDKDVIRVSGTKRIKLFKNCVFVFQKERSGRNSQISLITCWAKDGVVIENIDKILKTKIQKEKEEDMNPTKRCSNSKCNEIKQLTEFYKNKSRKDGYAGECKVCSKARRDAIKPIKEQFNNVIELPTVQELKDQVKRELITEMRENAKVEIKGLEAGLEAEKTYAKVFDVLTSKSL